MQAAIMVTVDSATSHMKRSTSLSFFHLVLSRFGKSLVFESDRWVLLFGKDRRFSGFAEGGGYGGMRETAVFKEAERGLAMLRLT